MSAYRAIANRPDLPNLARPILLVPGLLLLLFLAIPSSFEHKVHLALHGLCAQRPSHSYWFGDGRLPFDARMTGIYLGFGAAAVYLLARRAHRRSGSFTLPVLALLAAMVGIMAADGFNSLLLDLRLPYLYEPRNALRVVTGALAGVVLALALTYLSAVTFWRPSTSRRAPVDSARELAPLLLAPVLAMALLLWRPAFLYMPMSLLLMACAVAVIAWLALICIVLIAQREFTFHRTHELEPFAVRAIIVAVVVMGALSMGRVVVERLAGPSPLT